MLWYIEGIYYVLILLGLGLVIEGHIENKMLLKIAGGMIFLIGLIQRFD